MINLYDILKVMSWVFLFANNLSFTQSCTHLLFCLHLQKCKHNIILTSLEISDSLFCFLQYFQTLSTLSRNFLASDIFCIRSDNFEILIIREQKN